jgi:membrane-bound metal-dependent hydrolase YbcI (DUF457 family)
MEQVFVQDKIFDKIPAFFISGVVCVNNAKSIVKPIIIFRNNHNRKVYAQFIYYTLLEKV